MKFPDKQILRRRLPRFRHGQVGLWCACLGSCGFDFTMQSMQFMQFYHVGWLRCEHMWTLLLCQVPRSSKGPGQGLEFQALVATRASRISSGPEFNHVSRVAFTVRLTQNCWGRLSLQRWHWAGFCLRIRPRVHTKDLCFMRFLHGKWKSWCINSDAWLTHCCWLRGALAPWQWASYPPQRPGILRLKT